MENRNHILWPNMFSTFFSAVVLLLNLYLGMAQETKGSLKTYIVLVNLPEGKTFLQSEDLDNWYKSFLPASSNSNQNELPRMVYSYRNVITGFAARFSPEEVKAMEEKDGFVLARPQRLLALHTTHSPKFLGLHGNSGFWRHSNYGKGVIIGFLDTGITPNHPSFSDEGMPPPPAKWKGKCELNGTACNNKLIGARNFLSGDPEPPLDGLGHGTHTSSTAAGNFVSNANVYGNANGIAVGMAPRAHLAIYKVCSFLGCLDTDVLAAMDAAIEDGVDMLSLSLGGASMPFYSDLIAVGSYSAIKKGIFVSASAGNSGPDAASLSNEAPWILTVGASTIDRKIGSQVLLGNMEKFEGQGFFQSDKYSPKSLPLVYPGMSGDADASYCSPGSLNSTEVKGKVVLCESGGGWGRVDKGQEVIDAGGAAMIMMNQNLDAYSTRADIDVLPATNVAYKDGLKIKAYINSTSSPTASIIFKGTTIGVKNAPMVSSFSSRGPNVQSHGILKPDIIGPGVSILAAWPVSVDNNTKTKSTFNLLSGTSMSCPHLCGIAALLKSAHPNWSPAAIKSAIMTTADLNNLEGKPILDERLHQASLFAIGAGHVNPTQANHPGLIYDIRPADYIPYLCALGYKDKEVAAIARHTVNCSKIPRIPEAQLNYPSFSIVLGNTTLKYTRTVTNVGKHKSSYTVVVVPPPGVSVSVKPKRLHFSKAKKRLTYQVTFSRSAPSTSQFVQGYLTWISANHRVRSPISVKR